MLKGKRVGIVSNTGGLDSILADALTRYGFELAELPPSSVERLRPLLMAEASVRNPIDLVAPARPEQYAVTAEEMLACGQYDALLIAVVPRRHRKVRGYRPGTGPGGFRRGHPRAILLLRPLCCQPGRRGHEVVRNPHL